MGHHAPDGGEGLNPEGRPEPGGEAELEAKPNTVRDAGEGSAALERGRILFAGPCAYVVSAARIEQLPASGVAEVAFAGRSNVGKSSLVNALTGRRTLAKTSVTPGRTQQLNFFDLGGRLMLVDLPGYGYARAPKARVEAWSRVVEDYLAGRPPLRRALLLIDSRHGVKDIDRRIMAMLNRAAVAYQVVLTKADKITASALVERTSALDAELRTQPAAHPEVIATSVRTGAGIDILRASLAALSTWTADTSDISTPAR
ncbi:MAG: YihA family ribosome biogenesis GTP-binding protein [Rhodospirillales bacterium]|nr:YihA family ribosome biogenesis GTP-binding protein [Rhodospirillales bacterium]